MAPRLIDNGTSNESWLAMSDEKVASQGGLLQIVAPIL
jgi:hypothetical protein